MRSVWVLCKNTAIPTTYFVAPNRPPHSHAEKARWYESEHHANSALTFDMKHNGFVAKKVEVSCAQQFRHPKAS